MAARITADGYADHDIPFTDHLLQQLRALFVGQPVVGIRGTETIVHGSPWLSRDGTTLLV
jgi:hypothetical protein